ncbi:UxaA family hydrolase, partial [Escherichia coli]|nr:UxaA family hydrolase [Escherichia coli]
LMAVPVIKMATRTELANRWFDLMDINAGTIATGEETIEEVGWKLFHFILDVASGKKKTFSDQWGLHNQLAVGNDSNLLIVFYVQIMPDDFVMQLHR